MFDKKELYKFIEKNKKELDQYLRKYKSCYGFISFMPSSYRDIINEDDIERVVMCVIDYLQYKECEELPIMNFDSSIIYSNIKYSEDLEIKILENEKN